MQYVAIDDEWATNYATGALTHNRSEALASVSALGHATALMLAAKGGHMEAVQRLLEAGADANAGGGVYCEPETELDACILIPKAIGWATLAGRSDIVELLLQHGAKAKDGLLGAAAADGNTEILTLLLKRKAPAD